MTFMETVFEYEDEIENERKIFDTINPIYSKQLRDLIVLMLSEITKQPFLLSQILEFGIRDHWYQNYGLDLQVILKI